jgi:hypothetical protein
MQSTTFRHIYIKIRSNIILYPTALFFSGFAVKMKPAFVGNSVCASCSMRLIFFDLVVVVMFGDEYLYRTHYNVQ